MTISRRLAAHRQALASAAPEPTEIPDPEVPGEDEHKESENMTTETNEAALAAARAEGFAEAMARSNAVTGSEHYAGREALAATLLGNAKLSAEDITTALAAAPQATAAISASADEGAALAAMQAALADTANSNIDAGAAPSADSDAAAASVWDKAQANVFPGRTK